jgi:hypothetical protein
MICFIRIKYKRNLGDAIPQQLNFLYGERLFFIFIKSDLLSIRKDFRKYFFIYVDIVIYRRNIKYSSLFNFSAFELRFSMLLISNLVLDLLLFLDSAGGNSKSISNLLRFIAASIFFWLACIIISASR